MASATLQPCGPERRGFGAHFFGELMPLFFCDHCGREVPADKDGTCCNVDCVNQALEDQRLTELEADMDWAENHQPDIGGESG